MESQSAPIEITLLEGGTNCLEEDSTETGKNDIDFHFHFLSHSKLTFLNASKTGSSIWPLFVSTKVG